MPRYFFHRTDGHVDHDTEGTEFANEIEAKKAAVVYAGECLKFQPDLVWNGREFKVEVTDESGGAPKFVVTTSFSEL